MEEEHEHDEAVSLLDESSSSLVLGACATQSTNKSDDKSCSSGMCMHDIV